MSRRMFITHAVGLAAGVIAASFPYRGAQASALPLAGHRVVDLDLLDTERRRPIPSRLYLPQGARPAQPVPLVVFSHGLGGSRMGYRYLGSHWADEGIASLHPQHVGSDSRIWQGNPLELVQRLQAAASESEALARVLDLRSACHQPAGHRQYPRIPQYGGRPHCDLRCHAGVAKDIGGIQYRRAQHLHRPHHDQRPRHCLPHQGRHARTQYALSAAGISPRRFCTSDCGASPR